MAKDQKTVIGLLASHDDADMNEQLVGVFDDLASTPDGLLQLSRFQYVCTGGTYDRVFEHGGTDPKTRPVKASTLGAVRECGLVRLPDRNKGGVTLLGHLIASRQCHIVWPFLSPSTNHSLRPENLALIRLCDQWKVKRLMNYGSVRQWFQEESSFDCLRCIEDNPVPVRFRDAIWNTETRSTNDVVPSHELSTRLNDVWTKERPWKPPTPDLKGKTVALIAHDDMKGKMLEFVIDYERELATADKILTTETTGREVSATSKALSQRVYRYNSGPKGGDIQIAAEILLGRCQVVFFFVDSLHPHPHIEDIRVVFGACAIRAGVRVHTNEIHAREWMDRVVRAAKRPR